jgi:UDP-4-amino-4-deoxy-L-arabinose formyltransferase/UDP-glucuronic acid dehydrogenase (UDP-4-keto-hexauronic acid decarboxylating)
MRVAALGRTHWLLDSVASLVAAGHEIVLVATASAAPEYRVDEQTFEALGRDLGVPFLSDVRLEEHLDVIRACGAEVAVSVNWPTLVPRDVLDAFPLGVVNAHAGDLPRFRGNAAPNWAIITGEPQVAATLHLMDEGLDSGPILARRTHPLEEDTYIGDVYAFLDEAFPALFVEVVGGLADRSLEAVPQPADPSLSLRCLPRRPQDSELDWALPARQLARIVRASAEPFAGAFSTLDGTRLTVWRARAEEPPGLLLGVAGQVVERRSESGEVTVLTGEGVLVLGEVELDGRRVPATDVLGSTRLRLERAGG